MRGTLVALMLLSTASSLAVADTNDYLTDMLKRPAYAKAVEALLQGGKGLPAWTRQIVQRGGNYVDPPATYAEIAAEQYQLNNACEAQDCIDNQIEIMFAPGGGQAWGALVVRDNRLVDPAIRARPRRRR